MLNSTQVRIARAITFAFLTAAILIFVADAQAQGNRNSQAKLYFFTQAGCPPCQQMKPSVEWIKQYIDVTTVDTQHQQQWARHFNVQQTPTFVIASGNDVIARRVGAMSRVDLANFWNQNVPKTNSNNSERSSTTNAVANQSNSTRNVESRSGSQFAARQVSYESPSNSSSVNPTAARDNAYRSTVRLKIDEQGAVSYATGTVIHIHNNEALVVTCGHAFRENRGQGAITGHSGFADGRKNNLTGNLLYYDAGANDVALLVVKPATGLVASEIAAPTYKAKRGEPFFSYGCNHGQDPSILECSFLRLGEYSSSEDRSSAVRYDTTRRPVQGRSGGGLFNSAGQLIGICTGAAVEVDEGIYGSIDVIYRGISKAGLAQLFQGQGTPTQSFVSDNAQSAQRDLPQQHQKFNNASIGRSQSLDSQITPVTNRSNANRVEILCNVRSADAPNQVSQIVVRNPSQQLLQMLQSEGTIVNQPTRSASNNQEVIRAQSHR